MFVCVRMFISLCLSCLKGIPKGHSLLPTQQQQNNNKHQQILIFLSLRTKN